MIPNKGKVLLGIDALNAIKSSLNSAIKEENLKRAGSQSCLHMWNYLKDWKGGGIGSIEWEWDWHTNDGILPDLKGIFIEAHEWERKTERISYDDRK